MKNKGSLGKYVNNKWSTDNWEKHKEVFPDTSKICQN